MKTLNINNSADDFKILEQRIGDILNKHPNTKDFFEKYNIDFCCEGQKLLKDALVELNLNSQSIANELITIIKKSCNLKPSSDSEVIKSTEFINKSSEEIIDFIISHFHEGLRREFPKINEPLLKIMRAHITKHRDLFWGIHKLFCKIKDIFDGHLILEEELIFKTMIKFNNGEVSKESEEYKLMINSMKEAIDEHFIVGPTLKELSMLTDNYTPPKDSCKTIILVYNELHKLQDHIMAHTQIENNILFPRYLN